MIPQVPSEKTRHLDFGGFSPGPGRRGRKDLSFF